MKLVRGLCALLFALLASAAYAQPAERLDVYLFWATGCPHCEREIDFLERLEKEQARLRVHYLEVRRDTRAREAFLAIVERLGIEDPAVPLTLVGDTPMRGYGRTRRAARSCGA